MKINKVHVWKIERSKVDGMLALLGTDQVTATVKQGDPTIFANIAASNTSAAGRLRYSLETNQHDNVVWNEGDSDNRDANSDSDSYVNEKKKFQERRELTTNVTAVSDFLILQTSSGDQSVIYFQKPSPTKKVTETLDVPKTSKIAMWDSNPYSAAKWTPNQIHIGSYNGKYSHPTSKYTGSGSGSTVPTIFDSLPAGLNRTARPGSPLRLMETNLNVIDTIPNGEYVTGNSTMFYKYLSFHKGTNDTEFSSTTDSDYGMAGQSFDSAYSNTHSKVNDIVIHNPVSTELSMVIPLDSRRDQRTPLTQSIGGNLQPDIIEYDRVLDTNYRPNLLFNGDAEYVNPNESASGWMTWSSSGTSANFSTRVEDPTWTISDRSSFEISSKTKADNGGVNITGTYYQDVPVTPGMKYRLLGKTSCHRCTGGVYIDSYNSSGVGITLGSIPSNTTQTVQPFSLEVTAPGNAKFFRIGLVKGNSLAGVPAGSAPDYLFADDIKLINVDSQTADKPIGYKQVQVPNPDYVPPVVADPPVNLAFSFSGAIQNYTVPYTGTYNVETWGAQGATGTGGYVSGKGAYSKSVVSLTKGEVLQILVGGQGSNSGSHSGGGGGGTFVAKSGAPVSVAGGGGGAYLNYYNGTYYHGQPTQGSVQSPLTSTTATVGYGGVNSNPWGYSNSGAGGGFYGNGETGTVSYTSASGGKGFNNSGTVVGYGGYGGGGDGNPSTTGGGGGGYTGGSGGNGNNSSYYTGFGGGSFFTGTGSYAKGGWESMPSPMGVGTQIGQTGNGYVRITKDGTGSLSTGEPFAISNFLGLGYSGWGGTVNLTITSTVKVGDTAVIYTTNGNSENNTSYVPLIPSDFVKVGSATNGRQAYTKKIQASDAGRTISISGGSTFGYIFFTVPANFDLGVSSATSSTLTFDSGGKPVNIVSIMHATATTGEYTAYNTSYPWEYVYVSPEFPAGIIFPVPSNSASFFNYNYPHLVFVNSGYSSETTSENTTTFTYSGTMKTYTAPKSGTYTLEAWGAQGGNGMANGDTKQGGRGGYSKGEIALTAGQVLNIFVGGQGSSYGSSGVLIAGGWNGGGDAYSQGSTYNGASGGGATDIRLGGTALSNRIIVAGGGGGSADGGGSTAAGAKLGGDGGGVSGQDGSSGSSGSSTIARGGTQSAGGAGGAWPGWSIGGAGYLGEGGDATSCTSCGNGGGGGGYYGGGAGTWIAGAGGSGYVGGVMNGTTTAGVNNGNGRVTITAPDGDDPSNSKFLDQWVIDPEYNYSFPDEAYTFVQRTTPPDAPATVPGGGRYEPGNFINLDYGFEIYFPNKGDFLGDSAWGIGTTTATRGKGFYGNPAVAGDEMDTTEWTQSKSVTFDFNVIYNGVMYTSGEEIDLPVNCNSFNCRYPFYLPLANSEAISAVVTYKAIAINGIALDNDNPTNRIRGSMNLDAKHSAKKLSNIDVVGRIGNMAIEDTGDFRFSNFFKVPVSPTSWLVPNVVKRVDVKSQNRIIGDTKDIRGESVNASTRYLNTYGMTAHLQKLPVEFPLSPEKNSIPSLRRQPMRLGYNVLADLQTIGNYYDSVQIIPYYYSLDLQTGTYTPVDIYMLVNSSYKPINLFGAAVPGWDSSSVNKHEYDLDWESESGRRNYSSAERSNTESVIDFFATTDDGGEQHIMASPHGGKYPFGTAQIMYLQGRNRTFIGSSETYGADKNPGGTLLEQQFGIQGQRWHFTFGLPSSAIAIAHGQKPTKANIEAFRSNTSVLVMAADIVSIGDTFALRYESAGMNNPIQISGTNYATISIPYPVIAVYSSNKSSADDLEVRGTH
ncbi:glycine rich domain-containing protein [Cohnella panacarvi]|uniref:glycine rich domain-containing protein n=1 Tax=Cohnella panacarvi TaxID=400776 RepID=UPI00047A70F1|nr:glycine rich domain-containing protein [Cohnella panacarvi]